VTHTIRLFKLSVIGAVLAMAACADHGADEPLPASTVVGLQSTGQILPFNQLNAGVIARHPGSEVDHAALDKEGERFLFQAIVTDPYKMQWYVELDARTGQAVTDRQE